MMVKRDAARIFTVMPRELVERIDDFRFERRIASRAEAVRQLIEVGLEATSAGLRKTAK